MLQSLRSSAQSVFAKILFTVLLLGFVLWGVGPILHGEGRVQVAATAGKVEITEDQVQMLLQAGLRRVEAQSGSMPSSDVVEKVLRPALMRQLIAGALFDQQAREIGLRADDEMLKQSIAAETAFRDEQGRFSKVRYQQLLQTVGMSEGDYIRSLRQDITHGLMRGIIAGGVKPPEEIVRLMQAFNSEKRSVEALWVDEKMVGALPAPTPEELKALYDKSGSQFVSPEYRSLSYLFIDVRKLAEAARPSDAEVKKAYDDSPGDYSFPEKRDVLLLTTASKEIAEKVAAEAAAKGLDAAAKAENLIVHPIKDVTPQGGLIEGLSKIAFGLTVNKASDAIQSGLSWHVMQVTAITPSRPQSFDEARADIAARLGNEAAEKSAHELSRQLEDALAGGAAMAEAGAKLNLPLVKLENTDSLGNRTDGTKLNDEMAVRDILPIAFATPKSENSAIHDIPQGLMILHVDDVKDSQVKPFEAVQAEVEQGWRAEKLIELAELKAKELAAAAKTDQALPGAVKIGPMTRSGLNAGQLPREAVTGLFGLAKGETMTAKAPEGAWVVRVTDITTEAPQEADLVSARDSLKQTLAQERFVVFGQAIWQQYGVTIGGQSMPVPVN